jgi:hypothetical protein
VDTCPYPSCDKQLYRDTDITHGRDLSGELHPAARCPVHGWLATDTDRPTPLTPPTPPVGGGLSAPSPGAGPGRRRA